MTFFAVAFDLQSLPINKRFLCLFKFSFWRTNNKSMQILRVDINCVVHLDLYTVHIISGFSCVMLEYAEMQRMPIYKLFVCMVQYTYPKFKMMYVDAD